VKAQNVLPQQEDMCDTDAGLMANRSPAGPSAPPLNGMKCSPKVFFPYLHAGRRFFGKSCGLSPVITLLALA
jgi:hypothetical protein